MKHFADVDGVAWNVPAGGFFVVLTLPFVADEAALEASAESYGVLWTPMSHFYSDNGGRHQLRLSVSSVTTEEIDTGLSRLAAFVTDHL